MKRGQKAHKFNDQIRENSCIKTICPRLEKGLTVHDKHHSDIRKGAIKQCNSGIFKLREYEDPDFAHRTLGIQTLSSELWLGRSPSVGNP